jgi:hypothetical protein
MPNDFATATTEAATKIQEASRDSLALIWNASVANQQKATKLAKSYVDDAWTAGAASDASSIDGLLAAQEKVAGLTKGYVEEAWTAGAATDTSLAHDLLANLKTGQEAAQELALSYFSASVAALYFPFAVSEQVFRPQAA